MKQDSSCDDDAQDYVYLCVCVHRLAVICVTMPLIRHYRLLKYFVPSWKLPILFVSFLFWTTYVGLRLVVHPWLLARCDSCR